MPLGTAQLPLCPGPGKHVPTLTSVSLQEREAINLFPRKPPVEIIVEHVMFYEQGAWSTPLTGIGIPLFSCYMSLDAM